MTSDICFCIPSYNRLLYTYESVCNLLKLKGSKISVVVTINGLEYKNDTNLPYYERLKKKADEDSRLKIYLLPEINTALMNFYQALEHGNGEYLFHLNDYDWINIDYVEQVVSFLKSNNLGFALAGNTLSGLGEGKVFKAGLEGITRFGYLTHHPTGLIFKRDIWNKIENKERYFDYKYGVFPHAFVIPRVVKDYDCAEIYIPICGKTRPVTASGQFGTRYYTYDAVNNMFHCYLQDFYELNLDTKTCYELFYNRYRDFLFGATFSYQKVTRNIYAQKKYVSDKDIEDPIDKKHLIRLFKMFNKETIEFIKTEVPSKIKYWYLILFLDDLRWLKHGIQNRLL